MLIDAPAYLIILSRLLRSFSFIILYLLVGFGPGFILGILIANRLFGKDNPYRMEKHSEAVDQAAEHNKQWNPDDPRWQK